MSEEIKQQRAGRLLYHKQALQAGVAMYDYAR